MKSSAPHPESDKGIAGFLLELFHGYHSLVWMAAVVVALGGSAALPAIVLEAFDVVKVESFFRVFAATAPLSIAATLFFLSLHEPQTTFFSSIGVFFWSLFLLTIVFFLLGRSAVSMVQRGTGITGLPLLYLHAYHPRVFVASVLSGYVVARALNWLGTYAPGAESGA